jgi:acyl-coenzyme A synthetase/AMP-(fatty) acid ligase
MRLWESIVARGAAPAGALHAANASLQLADLASASALGGRLESLRGLSVLVRAHEPLAAAVALIELDGVARRVVLCPPGVAPEHWPGIVASAGIEACVRDSMSPPAQSLGIELDVPVQSALTRLGSASRRLVTDTQWVLLTSGTTGAPKLVLHSLAGLASALAAEAPRAGPVVWSTFYDIRRYGGLQIFLRAVTAGSLVLSGPGESVTEYLARAGALGVTHISGTPSHWRRALMSGAAARLRPQYVRLSGEIADQAILDSLRSTYPGAQIAHAFATTEAGVAFEVRDGKAGFPASLLDAPHGGVELRVIDETLRIRSPGNAVRYLGEGAPALRGPDGFVDTGDRVQLREGRYYFAGRRGGVINVGGLKVYPEEVEAAINGHPWVRMSLVKARRSPITGALVAADVVLSDPGPGRLDRPPQEVLGREILDRCRGSLAPHKIPAIIRFVPALEVSESGKLVRPEG